MTKPRYSVLTCVFGKNYEKLREVSNPQPDVEYVCVSDDPDLKSETWKIVRPDVLRSIQDPFAKLFVARYNQFSFASSDTAVWIDGSIHLTGSLDRLVGTFETSRSHVCLMPHPFSGSIVQEYEHWIRLRGYPLSQTLTAISWMLRQPSGVADFAKPGQWQLCFSIRKKCPEVAELDGRVQKAIAEISAISGKTDRLDQPIFTFVLRQYLAELARMDRNFQIFPVSEQVLRSEAMQRYAHGIDEKNDLAFYHPVWPEVRAVEGQPVEDWMDRPQTKWN